VSDRRPSDEVEHRGAADADGDRHPRAGCARSVSRGARVRARLPETRQHRRGDRPVQPRDRARSALRAGAGRPRRRALQKYEASHDAAWVPQARALDPESPAAHVCLGTVALGTGAFDEAAGEFQRALNREPTSDEANLGLARALARSGATDAAEATYKRAIALRPQYWATHIWLGTFYREHARYAEAVQQYELALTLTSDNARVYYILGGLYGSIGRYDEAIAACRKSAELVPSWDAYSNWGMTLFRLRRFDEAVNKLEATRKIGPDTYRLLGNLARADDYVGKRTDAMALSDGHCARRANAGHQPQ
jgi:tetratricopeptide (TPR) repeat protein